MIEFAADVFCDGWYKRGQFKGQSCGHILAVTQCASGDRAAQALKERMEKAGWIEADGKHFCGNCSQQAGGGK